MSSDAVLLLSHIKRTFGTEKFIALDDLSLTIYPGEIVALLGSNGAGKTTTVKIASTMLLPTEGSVYVHGIDAVHHPYQARQHIGLVLGGDLGFYPRASAYDNLRFFADIARVPFKYRESRIQEVLKLVQLTDSAHKAVHTFSRGMTQRLHIARALLHKPKLLILDEPTNGLDPDIALHIRNLIKELVQQGMSVLLTSHLMAEVEDLAHRINVIYQGKIFIEGTVEDIARSASIEEITTGTYKADALPHLKLLVQALSDEAWVNISPVQGHYRLSITWKQHAHTSKDLLEKRLNQVGLMLPEDLVTRAPNLEEAYLALIERLKTC